MMSSPPGRTRGSNFSSEGRFMTIATSGSATTGEPMGSSEMTTVHVAVPPRCSGPYDGIHVACFPSSTAAFVRISPRKRIPCPPNPAMMSSIPAMNLRTPLRLWRDELAERKRRHHVLLQPAHRLARLHPPGHRTRREYL